ncbi:MAG: hypothetical protein Q7S74_04605 [Nanoarchaeota archaeon]|nr:hypothetical protein [Nanoarchaeota archaeon]
MKETKIAYAVVMGILVVAAILGILFFINQTSILYSPQEPVSDDFCYNISSNLRDMCQNQGLWNGITMSCKDDFLQCLSEDNSEGFGHYKYSSCFDQLEVCQRDNCTGNDCVLPSNKTIVVGDLDNDGTLTSNDIMLYDECSCGGTSDKPCSIPYPVACGMTDLNNDGFVTIEDINLLGACKCNSPLSSICTRPFVFELRMQLCGRNNIDPIGCYREFAFDDPVHKVSICAPIQPSLCAKYPNWPTCTDQIEGQREACIMLMPFID